MGGLQPWHWLIVIAVFVLLFGAKKLPDAARSPGAAGVGGWIARVAAARAAVAASATGGRNFMGGASLPETGGGGGGCWCPVT